MKHLIWILVLTTATAHAEDRAAAERYFRAGAKAYAAQNFEAAAADFNEAYKNLAMPEIAFSAAQAYRRLYRINARPEYVRRAVELYHVYLEHVKAGGRVGDAADGLAEMQHELDKLGGGGHDAPVVEQTQLGVSVTIAGESDAMHEIGDAPTESLAGLTATLDGKPIAPFALVEVTPAEHRLAVSADGYFAVEKKATAVKGQSQLIEIELKPKPAKVVLHTEDDAQIAVDGRPGSATLELAAGKHLVTIAHRGREPFARELTVVRGQELSIDAPLASTARRRAVPWVATGAVLTAGAATATCVLAFVHDHRASDQRTLILMGNAPPSAADAYDREVQSRDHYATATWVLGGTALAAAAVAAGLYFFDTPLPVAPEGAGLAYTGHF